MFLLLFDNAVFISWETVRSFCKRTFFHETIYSFIQLLLTVTYMLGTNPCACRCLFPLRTKRQIIWYLPFFIIWIDSDALCKTFIYLLCGFYNGWIQNCWPVQLWLCSAWNLWKTCPTKIKFMIIGTIYFRYTEISTVYKLVHMIPSQCLEEVFDVSISILYEDSDLERLSNLPKITQLVE